jgi:hypothetical protein
VTRRYFGLPPKTNRCRTSREPPVAGGGRLLDNEPGHHVRHRFGKQNPRSGFRHLRCWNRFCRDRPHGCAHKLENVSRQQALFPLVEGRQFHALPVQNQRRGCRLSRLFAAYQSEMLCRFQLRIRENGKGELQSGAIRPTNSFGGNGRQVRVAPTTRPIAKVKPAAPNPSAS